MRTKVKPDKIPGAWILGLVFLIVGIMAIAGYEIYWVKVIMLQRKGLAAAVTIDANKLNTTNEGKLVHVIGTLGGTEKLSDTDFGVSIDALKLRRRVWLRQWKQGDKELTTRTGTEDMKTHEVTINKTNKYYRYSEEWSEDLIDSRSFHNIGYDNPREKKIPNRLVESSKISLGTFTLSSELAGKIDSYQIAPLSDKNITTLNNTLKTYAKFTEGELFIGKNLRTPQVGDLKIRIDYVPATTFSIIALQTGNNLLSTPVDRGGEKALIQVGSHSVEEMTGQFVQSNFEVRRLIWILGGLFILFGLRVLWVQKLR